MTDPYETIGVPKDANPDTIKKTYRKRAKENHPDNGGDQQKMADLAVAYSILSDPDKRERYDKTGNAEEESLQGMIYAEFCRFCDEILLNREGLPFKQNVDQFKANVEKHYAQNQQAIDKKRKVLEKAKARIVKAPEHDPLSWLIVQKLNDLQKQQTDLEKQCDIARKALAMFEGYEIAEPEPRSPWDDMHSAASIRNIINNM